MTDNFFDLINELARMEQNEEFLKSEEKLKRYHEIKDKLATYHNYHASKESRMKGK